MWEIQDQTQGFRWVDGSNGYFQPHIRMLSIYSIKKTGICEIIFPQKPEKEAKPKHGDSWANLTSFKFSFDFLYFCTFFESVMCL